MGLHTRCNIRDYNEKTAQAHRKIIRAQHGWKPFDQVTKSRLIELAGIHANEQLGKEETLFALLEYCWRNKVEISNYATLESVVLDANDQFLKMTCDSLRQHITEGQRAALLSFIDQPDIAMRLSRIKRIDQGLSQKILIENAELLVIFRDTFLTIRPLIDQLELSNQAAKELSKWVYKSTLPQIRRFKDADLLLLRLAAFVKDQLYLRQDYAVDGILKTMRSTVNKARGHDRKQRDKLQEAIHEINRSVLYSAKNADTVDRRNF